MHINELAPEILLHYVRVFSDLKIERYGMLKPGQTVIIENACNNKEGDLSQSFGWTIALPVVVVSTNNPFCYLLRLGKV